MIPYIIALVLNILHWYSMREGPKVSGLTYRSRAKWKMLQGI